MLWLQIAINKGDWISRGLMNFLKVLSTMLPINKGDWFSRGLVIFLKVLSVILPINRGDWILPQHTYD